VSPLVSELRRETDLLIRRVGHWGPPRWVADAGPGQGSRADAVHALIQRLADRSADAEGEPRRAVPRLDNDLALVDQLRVVASDLERAGSPDALAEAAADMAATRSAL
jgi:hypothetical protein